MSENDKNERVYPSASIVEDVLVLVNKTHPVTEDYAAEDLIPVAWEHREQNMDDPETGKLRRIAAEAFEELHAGAENAGYQILMRTGYRSYAYQKNLFNHYASVVGEEAANIYSAKPGQSEHQTGLCCDVGIKNRALEEFAGTGEAKWIADNAWKYGFILRYPEGKSEVTDYMYEPWHIRYVGKGPAEVIYKNRWTLEEYLEKNERQR